MGTGLYTEGRQNHNMCFSATASFVVSGALVGAGAASLKMSKRSERLMAMIPLLFAFQQAIEGLQWLVPHPGVASQALIYAYLFFAFLLWPVYLPLAVYQLERRGRRKRLLEWLVAIGITVALLLLGLLFVVPATVIVSGDPIIYTVPVPPMLYYVGTFFYSVAVVGSLLISSRKPIPLFGVLVLLTEVASLIFFPRGFISIWCFFAAISSIFVVLCFYYWSQARQR